MKCEFDFVVLQKDRFLELQLPRVFLGGFRIVSLERNAIPNREYQKKSPMENGPFWSNQSEISFSKIVRLRSGKSPKIERRENRKPVYIFTSFHIQTPQLFCPFQYVFTVIDWGFEARTVTMNQNINLPNFNPFSEAEWYEKRSKTNHRLAAKCNPKNIRMW
jgi:hypothetical protein